MNIALRRHAGTRCANPIVDQCCRPFSNTTPHVRKYASKPRLHDGRQFRLAVIGSGPAGFYTAYKVMSKIENSIVDMYEHLPVPYGLVRFGVAPDHPEVKVSCLSLKVDTMLTGITELPGKVRGSRRVTEI
jgi:adrenodoxin-NADP+ reductase